MTKKLNTENIKKRKERTAEIVSKPNEHEKSEIIPVDDIDFNKDNFFNKFDTEEDIEDLAKSIEENGLIHPINVVRIENDRYMLISGERRLKAYKRLGKTTIRATVVPNLSEIEILKRTFFGNTDVRNYTLEQKLEIISMYKAKLDELSVTGNYDVAEFKKQISEAFNIDSRQTNKLISINNGLIDKLIKLMCSEKLDINTCAAYSNLPVDCQEFICQFFVDEVINDTAKFSEIKKIIGEFATKIKSVVSKEKEQKRKIQANITYNEKKANQNEKELETVESEIEGQSKANPALLPTLENRKNNLEKSIAKNKNAINNMVGDLSLIEKKKQAEIEKIKTSYEFIIKRKIEEDSSEQQMKNNIQTENIDKEVKKIEKSIKKLSNLLSHDELIKLISSLLK